MLGTFIDTSRWWAKERSSQAAIITEHAQLNYQELNSWANGVCAWLIGQGLQTGDRVVVLAANSLEWCVLSQGVMRAGGVLAPINFRSTASEVSYMLKRYEPAFIFFDDERQSITDEATSSVSKCQCVNLKQINEWPKHAELPSPERELNPDDYLVIIPTSGSTGRPKGVVYSHKTLMEYVLEFALTEAKVVEQAKFLLFAPLSTSAGYNLMSKFLACGGTLYIHQTFDPAVALQSIVHDKINTLMGVPLFYESMAALPEFKDADISSLTIALCGGAPVPRQLMETWHAKGVLLRQLYGQTEVGGHATYNTVEAAQSDPDKCGYGLPFKRVAVINDDGEFCPPNVQGQIVVKGPGIMVKYWRDPQATAKTLVDGWVRTGDLGILDERGLLKMVDRLKDVIISGGLNISAAEVERVIMEIPGVQEVAVIAAKDDKFGETPMAVIYATTKLNTQEIIQHCDNELSNFKVPRYVVLEDGPLPRVATGKIAKPVIRKKYQDAHLTLNKAR